MQKDLDIPAGTIPYTIRRSTRARHVRLTVYGDGRVVLTSPIGVGEQVAERFVREHAEWLAKKLEFFRKRRESWEKDGDSEGDGEGDGSAAPRRRYTRRDYLRNKPRVREFVERKIAELNKIYDVILTDAASVVASSTVPFFRPTSITIRNQKTRWGSCSRRGALSFNWRIVLLPPRVQDYLVVHELCHLREFNHSPRFWALIARAVPEYREIRRVLRQPFSQ